MSLLPTTTYDTVRLVLGLNELDDDLLDNERRVGIAHVDGTVANTWERSSTAGIEAQAVAHCIAAYGFLVSERSLISPSASPPAPLFKAPRLPKSYRPRGAAAPSRTPRRQLHRHNPH